MVAGWGCVRGDCEEEKSKALLRERRDEMQGSERTGREQADGNVWLDPQEIEVMWSPLHVDVQPVSPTAAQSQGHKTVILSSS